jgi:hypothetical protein
MQDTRIEINRAIHVGDGKADGLDRTRQWLLGDSSDYKEQGHRKQTGDFE